MHLNNILQSNIVKYKSITKAGKDCIQLDKYDSSFSLGKIKQAQNNVFKVSFEMYLDSKEIKENYGAIHYKDPNSSRSYLGVVVDLQQLQKDRWIDVDFYLPDFDVFDSSTLHFSRNTWLNHGLGATETTGVAGLNMIAGVYVHRIQIDNELRKQSFILPKSKFLEFMKDNFILLSTMLLLIFLVLSRYYLYFLISFSLFSLTLLGIVFFPAIGSNILLDQEQQHIAQIESDAKEHLYKLSGLKEKYEFNLSSVLRSFNKEANNLVNRNHISKMTKLEWKQSFNHLIQNAKDRTGLDIWVCNSNVLYNKGKKSKSESESKLAFKDFVRLLFPIIEGKVMERKDSSPLEKDRYRTKINVFKDFIETAFDNSDFLHNFLTNPNRLFRMSTGSSNTSKGMDQSMWSYFVDSKGSFWLVFAKVNANIIVGEYSKEVEKYAKSHKDVKIQLLYAKNMYSFPTAYNTVYFNQIMAAARSNTIINKLYDSSLKNSSYYASIKHPNHEDIFLSLSLSLDKYIKNYQSFLSKKEYTLISLIIALFILSYLLNYLISMPIYRLSKSVDLILSKDSFYLRTLGFGQFRELESVIVTQNEQMEKQRVLSSLQDDASNLKPDSNMIVAIVNHSIFQKNDKLIQRASYILHVANEVYIYVYSVTDLDFVLKQEFSILMPSRQFKSESLNSLQVDDIIFSKENRRLISKELSSDSPETTSICSDCFKGEFYELP
ncbi:MAG: hypothetical protein KC646_04720 [Candidatus Cloacimonetes bacterium]|nr:hypothetical protein [Candidatus Cloacimonadota bacterium]